MKCEHRPEVYLLHGMKRSGNHALVNWLRPQLHCTFVNNALPLGQILRSGVWPQPLPFDDWWARTAEQDPLPGTLLATIEDHELGMLPFDATGVHVQRLLIVRSPKQLFSSRIRKASRVDMPAYPRTNDAIMKRAVSVWKQHARCLLGHGLPECPGRIAVSYDAWCASLAYRRAVSAAIEVEFDDTGFARVSGEGGGSSFDGTAFDGFGNEMNTADRAAQLEPRERKLLDDIFEDDELRRLEGELARMDPFRQLRLD